jgi:hypothetical protein
LYPFEWSTDVRELDDVRLGLEGQGAEFGEGVADPLILTKTIRERGDDATGQRDVADLDVDPGVLGEGLHDRQEGVGGQGGGLVGLGVEDGWLGHDPVEVKEAGSHNQSKRGLPPELVPLNWDDYGQNASRQGLG